MSPATTERRNTSKTTQFGYTPPAETAVAPKPEVALRPFLLTSKSIVVYIQKYHRDLIHITSGVAIDDETSKDVENDAIWLYAAGADSVPQYQ